MSHFYDGKTWELLGEVTTPSQARKHGNAYASVTTKLGLDNEGLKHWEYVQLVNLARQDHDAGMEELHERKFGYRTTPDGQLVTSSEYGTRFHQAMEDRINSLINAYPWPDDPEWEPACDRVLNKLEEAEYLHSECRIGSDQFRTVGTIDLVFKKDGLTYLGDYKTRSCRGEPSKKSYNKDRNQLAIEAYMWAKHYVCPIPRTMSIIYCTDSGNVHLKTWSWEQQAKGVRAFAACSAAYDVLNGLDDGNDLLNMYNDRSLEMYEYSDYP